VTDLAGTSRRWPSIAAVSAGYLHTVGLTTDGRVLAAGDSRL